jgi:hypothetical protein
MAAHIAREALTGNPANLRADHLNCAHKRVGKQERPSQRVADVGSHFGVTIQLEENQRFNRKRVFENIHLN